MQNKEPSRYLTAKHFTQNHDVNDHCLKDILRKVIITRQEDLTWH